MALHCGKAPRVCWTAAHSGLRTVAQRTAEKPGLRQDVYDLMPRANIADVLLKVDDWTWFWDCFTHQPSGRAADDSDG